MHEVIRPIVEAVSLRCEPLIAVGYDAHRKQKGNISRDYMPDTHARRKGQIMLRNREQ